MEVYQLVRVIGRGAYGTILLCRDCTDNTLAVIKEVNIKCMGEDSHKEALNEIQVLSRLNHPYIISFYRSFIQNNCVYISMEYATHGNLAEFMFARQPSHLSATEILYLFCQILMGLQHIHENNIVHRDIKAENIFLSGDNGMIVKIGDFGISKILGDDKASTIIGTPYYLAPELCKNEPYDTKTDVWALGCLLYEMCTHRRAFDSTTLVGLVNIIVSGNFTPIDKQIYDISMQELIDSMLTVLPQKRPSVADILKKPYLFPMLCSLHSSVAYHYSYTH